MLWELLSKHVLCAFKKSCKNEANKKFKRIQIDAWFLFNMQGKKNFIMKKNDIERYRNQVTFGTELNYQIN